MRLLLIVVLLTLAGCQASIGIPKADEQGGAVTGLVVRTFDPKTGKKTSECLLNYSAMTEKEKAALKTKEVCGGLDVDVRRITQGDASITQDVVAANTELAKMRQEFIQEFGPKVGERFFDYLVGRLGLPVPE